MEVPNMIVFKKEGHIAKVGLNKPETKNALDPETLLELQKAWEECQADDSIRVVVFYSELPEIFCSGMDIKKSIPFMLGTRKPETEAEKWLAADFFNVSKAMLKIKDLDRPIIAAINGYCLTGGWEMAMGCELRIASEDAVFQMRETKLGLMPAGGSNVFLPAQIGSTRALEILLTGEDYTAKTLYEWGFLNKVVPRDKLMDEAMGLARKIAENGPRSIRAMVKCARDIQGKPLKEALGIEMALAGKALLHEDAKEGFLAQKEGRKPNFPA